MGLIASFFPVNILFRHFVFFGCLFVYFLFRFSFLSAPVYNAHPYFEACFQKKSVSTSFLSKNNFLEKFSRNVKSSSTCIKSVTGADANHLMFCLFSDTLSFRMFSSCSSAVLLLHDRMRSLCTAPVTFL